jgi:hypothetical protein
MQDRDWTGTAAAVTALAMTAAVWLWPQAETPRNAAPVVTLDDRGGDDMARWHAEAQRWDGLGTAVQLSSAQAPETVQPVVR